MKTQKEFDIDNDCKSKTQISTGWKLISVCKFFGKRLINCKQLGECKIWLRENKTCDKCQDFNYEPKTGRLCLKGNIITNNKSGMPKPKQNNCWEELKNEKEA